MSRSKLYHLKCIIIDLCIKHQKHVTFYMIFTLKSRGVKTDLQNLNLTENMLFSSSNEETSFII
ncbi:hypothetical protein Hanom_Chr10g00872231 [Helianthus anomalus]